MGTAEPLEYVSTGPCHNFNMQLVGAPLVSWAVGTRTRTQLVVPGQVSLNAANEPFRCVVRSAMNILTLHVILPPVWIAGVRERDVGGRSTRECGLTPIFGEWDDQVRRIALGLADAVRSAGSCDQLLLDQLQLSLAVALLGRSGGGQARRHAVGGLSVVRLREAVAYMHAHLGEVISLPDLAAVTDLSTYHFARSFKASVGVSPHRYLTAMRLEKARLLLATTNRSVTEIALALGFDTPSHFATAFRAGVGVTPSAFRRRAT